jgi:hypothetical protein
MDLDDFFAGRPESRRIFDAIMVAVGAFGQVSLRVSRSQVALVLDKTFAVVWIPEMYLQRPAAPLVLTVSFPESREWERWKEIYQVGAHRFTHHLELWAPEEVDSEVLDWLKEARETATRPQKAAAERQSELSTSSKTDA